MVSGAEEDRLTARAALRDVIGQTGSDTARVSRHSAERVLAEGPSSLNMSERSHRFSSFAKGSRQAVLSAPSSAGLPIGPRFGIAVSVYATDDRASRGRDVSPSLVKRACLVKKE